MKPRLLDLFCGAGGAAMGYHRAGFEVIGVDIKPQPRYPFEFIQADALDYVWDRRRRFDAIHASPPCQAYSSKTMDRKRHPDLVAATRQALRGIGKPYVIENVHGAPLVLPVRLCGSSFKLRVRRHRLFECSWFPVAPDCNHQWQDGDRPFRLYDHGKWFQSGIVHVFGTGGGKGKEHWPEAMGIDWMTYSELTQAIPPAYTEFIGKQLIEVIK